jgi:hypothetical protein
MESFLHSKGVSSMKYLIQARKVAKENGYDDKSLFLCDDGVHKLCLDTPTGIRKFGRVGYGDYRIWLHLENQGVVPEGTANKKRYSYHRRHEASIKKHNITDKFSPAILALTILW